MLFSGRETKTGQLIVLEMARNCAEEKWAHSNSIENEVEDEEEALSLCDLPINIEENLSRKEEAQAIQTPEDFEFGSWGGSVLIESELCDADEVFFQGQILPLRHSISSESSVAGFRNDSQKPGHCLSRSDSMDHCHSGTFTSVSSRSSSIRSCRSSSSGSSSTKTTVTTTKTKYKPRVQNPFHSHPSPTPQIRVSSIQHGNIGHRSNKSTIWSFFRVGLVRTPEIELQDLKVRGNNNGGKSLGSLNSSTTSSVTNINNSTTNDCNDDKNGSKRKKKKTQRFFDKNGALFGGCKCSVNAVETVLSPIVIIKSNSIDNVNEAIEKEEKKGTLKKAKQRNGKQVMSRHRTFEWLKELSFAGVPDEA
ncbi:hypothetical protein F0562_013016 [Nyssa sinensis]|uniref:Uncharacterized protein n=1 Tax=Nyssa sinensis TaxID=561372 RepID=A0A5J4ZUX2_9ASTE|nr:hypothetical protein F0562_013016 [Nyssa sinensis]